MKEKRSTKEAPKSAYSDTKRRPDQPHETYYVSDSSGAGVKSEEGEIERNLNVEPSIETLSDRLSSDDHGSVSGRGSKTILKKITNKHVAGKKPKAPSQPAILVVFNKDHINS